MTLLKQAGWKRPVVGALAGFAGSSLENQALLDDSDPRLKHINQFLGTLTGVTAPAKGLGKHLLRAWVPKQFAMFGLDAYDKSVKQQVPIANTQLQTAVKALETAKIQADAAKRFSPTDLAQMGLAGAGLGAAGGLGYYLYNTMGPGKKKPSPRVTVTLPTKEKGDAETQISGDMDTLDLSKELYKRMKRDTKRRLRTETKERTRHESPRRPARDDETPQLHGIVREKPDTSTMANIMNLLRN